MTTIHPMPVFDCAAVAAADEAEASETNTRLARQANDLIATLEAIRDGRTVPAEITVQHYVDEAMRAFEQLNRLAPSPLLETARRSLVGYSCEVEVKAIEGSL